MRPESRSPTNGRDLQARSHPVRPVEERTVPQLLKDFAEDGAELMREEVALAKAEMNEKLEAYQKATMTMGAGGVLMLAAVLTLLWAVNRGLTALLAQGMELDIAVWLSPLILTVLLAAVGAALLSAGRKRMRRETLVPRRTKATLEENARWAKSKAREMRSEGKHA